LALEEEKKEREAALSEAREVSRKAVEEAMLLREWAMTVEEVATKAREEAVFYKGAATDLEKEKGLRPRILSKDEDGVREGRDCSERRGGGQEESPRRPRGRANPLTRAL